MSSSRNSSGSPWRASNLLVLLLATGFAWLPGCAPRAAQDPPNIILVTVDTLRADALLDGPNRARTPHLDELIARGTRFTQAIAPMPRTTPALATLLTGLWPHEHGSREVGDPIRNDVTTLATILAQAGYSTAAVSANNSAGPKQSLDRGFESFVSGDDLKSRYEGRLYRDRTDVPPTGVGWAEATTDETLRLAAAAPPEKPLLLWTLYFDPHFFYRPPSPWQDEHVGSRCFALYDAFLDGQVSCGEIVDARVPIASEALDDCRELYRKEVEYTDSEIGRLLDGLEELGRLDNAIVVFTADHGENLGEGGLHYEHGENVHDAGLRVPLAIVGPDVAAGRDDDGVTGLIDVMPTLLGILGLDQPATSGVDLGPRLSPESSGASAGTRRALFAESASGFCGDSHRLLTTGRMEGRACIRGDGYAYCVDAQSGAQTLYDIGSDPRMQTDVLEGFPEVATKLKTAFERWPPESARERTARTSRYKLVQRPLFEGGYRTQLYDLHVDPGETTDVLAQHVELGARLAALLEEWTAGIGPMRQRELDEELLEDLRALGYVE